MTVYNKLKIAILAIISSQTFAITIDPIQVQSGSGDLLYAEMKFRHSDPNARIEVGLAEANDLMTIGVAHQPPGHLNFFTRRTGDGSGVIVITSSRPVVDSELNILLKIKEGSATHIQQVKTALKRSRPVAEPISSGTEKALIPQIIVSEKDIQLNLPSSSQYQALNTAPTSVSTSVQSNTSAQLSTPVAISITPSHITPLVTQKSAPPLMNSTAVINPEKSNATVFNPQVTPTIISTPQATVQPETKVAVEQVLPTPEQNQATQKKNPQVEEKAKTTTTNKQSSQQTASNKTNTADKHIVQANESLWRIASRIASQSNQSVPEVMRQIKANNEHAFIQGDINRIRRGVALNLSISAQKATKNTSKQKAIIPPTTQKQSGKAKYRLGQDEMSLVADNNLDAAHGKSKKDHQQNQTNAELSTKVMTSREKTVKLQKNVSELALALQQKDQRIQLLNARLAQLQQQLQQQNRSKKSAQ